MDTRRGSSVRVQRGSSGFTTVLTYAVLEWFLIFLLFVNALFSYFLTRLAHFWELQIPCLLCSRLDHVLGNKTPGFYWDLICGAHKLEISSMVFCHVHNKLADVHGMCEGCLFSFATKKKSNSETFKSLVGTLGTDFECCVDHIPLLKDPSLASSSKMHCSCCNEPWTLRLDTYKLARTKFTGSEVTELDVPLPGSVEKSCLHLHNGLKKSKEKTAREVTSSNVKNHNFDPLSHIGYAEVKITSDSESEVPFSDDDDGSSLVRERDDLKEEFKAQCASLDPHTIHPEISLKTLSDDLTSENVILQASWSEPSLVDLQVQDDVGESHDFTFSASAASLGHGLEDLSLHQVEEKTDPSTLSKLISLDNVPSSPDVGEALELLADTSGVTRTDVLETASTIGNNQEICKLETGSTTTTGIDLKKDQLFDDCGPPTTNLMDLSDAYKLAIGNKGNQVSNKLAEKPTVKDSARVSEDLKLWLSQVSSARGLELSSSEMSPRVHGHWEDLKISDASSSIGLQILQKRISLERNESGFESLDGSIVSEIEGENVVDRLKRQVEYDRKSMSALYKELEEERNASAIAANQALAMITRLQEEKATLQMEALQYLRMMEEQAEYDVDALQKANDHLAEKEKEVQDLEAKLEIFRAKFECKSVVEKIQETVCDSERGDMRVEHSGEKLYQR